MRVHGWWCWPGKSVNYNASILVRMLAFLGIYMSFYKNGVQYSVFPLFAVCMKMRHQHLDLLLHLKWPQSFHDRNEKSLFVESEGVSKGPYHKQG